MKKVWFRVSMSWKPLATAALASAVILFMLFFHLGSLTKGAHPIESQVKQALPTYNAVLKEPANAPYYIARNTIIKLRPNSGIVISRGLSAIAGAVCIALFYGLVSLWYRPRVAVLATLLFASSNWLLRSARMGVPEIQQSLLLALIFLPAWLRRRQHINLALTACVLAVGYLFYIPGMIWFIALGIVWRAKYMLDDLRKVSRFMVIGLILMLILLLLPLAYAVIQNPVQLLRMAGIPADFAIGSTISHLGSLFVSIFVRGSGNAFIGVGNLPILDVFTSFMVIVGFIDTIQSRQLDRSKLVLGILVIGIILSAIGRTPQFVLVLPAIYLLVAAGLAYMLNAWLSVFPKNPLARGIATILISTSVLFAAAYNVTNYFIAWPNTDQTKTTFNQRY